MKKLFFLGLAVVAFSMTSCVKTWTCTCTYTDGTNTTTSSTSLTGTKTQAKAACNTTISTGSATQTCELSK